MHHQLAYQQPLLKQICNIEASFADAAVHCDKAFVVSVVDTVGKVIYSAPVRRDPEATGQMVIALAMQDCQRDRVYSDSEVAVRAFKKGQ